jgi:hypothetical protein
MGKREAPTLDQQLAGKNPKAVAAITRKHEIAVAKSRADAIAKEDAAWCVMLTNLVLSPTEQSINASGATFPPFFAGGNPH